MMLDWKPDIVFTADNVAFNSVTLAYNQMRLSNGSLPLFPFTFCGVTQDLSLISPSLLYNTRGVSVFPPFDLQLSTSLLLSPQAKKVAFVRDNSEEGKYIFTQLEKLYTEGSLNTTGLPVEFYTCTSFSLFQQTLNALNSSDYAVIVQSAHLFLTQEGANTSVPSNLVTAWIMENVPPSFVGPVEQGFVINVQYSSNTTCTLAGIFATQYLDSGVFNGNSKTQLEALDFQISVFQDRFYLLTDSTPSAPYFRSSEFISSAVFFNPLITDVKNFLSFPT